jgi:hypothetical protein
MSADLDTVGIDFSALPFEPNVSRTKVAADARNPPSATRCPRRHNGPGWAGTEIAALDLNVIHLVGKTGL